MMIKNLINEIEKQKEYTRNYKDKETPKQAKLLEQNITSNCKTIIIPMIVAK